MDSKLIASLSKKIPYSYLWVLKKSFTNCETILDVGCGDGRFFSLIKRPDWYCEGIDAYKPATITARTNNVYSRVYHGDAIEVCRKLVNSGKRYDGIFCSQLIEHVSHKKGNELLAIFEKIATKIIVIATPNSYMPQPDGYGEKDNRLQEHLSGWNSYDFLSRGYGVVGVGLKIVWSEKGIARSKIRIISLLGTILSAVSSPITYYVTTIASGLVAIKKYEK